MCVRYMIHVCACMYAGLGADAGCTNRIQDKMSVFLLYFLSYSLEERSHTTVGSGLATASPSDLLVSTL